MRIRLLGLALLGLPVLLPAAARAASVTKSFSHGSGLAGEATFTWTSGSALEIVLTNTSTGVPSGFSNSDQLLTSVAFDLPGSIAITGGTATITSGSASVNFDQVTDQLTGGADVSPEYGYGNGGTTGFGTLVNYVSAMEAGTEAKFAGGNLDGPFVLDGPQGGLLADPALVSIGGLGAIQTSVTFDLTLSAPLSSLDFLDDGVIMEFGSDAAFLLPLPSPAWTGLALLLGLFLARRGRRAAAAERALPPGTRTEHPSRPAV